jgi:formylglycine-generating enzyme required for sulfatase activity
MRKVIWILLLAVVSRSAMAEKAEAEMQPGKVFKDCPDCPEMVVIPAGSFKMGTNNWSDVNAMSVHPVTISRAFALGKTEITQGQWRAMMNGNPSDSINCGDDCPVENVSWDDVQVFIQKFNAKTGRQYRLPSEAEWEYACRAGEQQKFCGSENLDSVAWYGGNSSRSTHPAGRKQANAWGLYDMSGNVWEWVEDRYMVEPSGPGSVAVPTDFWAKQGSSSSSTKRGVRGGSWDVKPGNATAASRKGVKPASLDDDVGFRLASSMLNAPSPEPVVDTPSSNTSPTQSESAVNRLKALNTLYKEGLINQKDFETKKQEILKSM